MDRKDRSVHYHIRCGGILLPDFESFNTRVDAEAGAQVLACPGETYTIEEHGENCQRCQDAMNAESAHGGAQVYREPE